MRQEQRQILSDFVDKFREAEKEVVPDYLGKNEIEQFYMTREQLEDFADRCMKVALSNLPPSPQE